MVAAHAGAGSSPIVTRRSTPVQGDIPRVVRWASGVRPGAGQRNPQCASCHILPFAEDVLLDPRLLLGGIARRHGRGGGRVESAGGGSRSLERALDDAADLAPPDVIVHALAAAIDAIPDDEIADRAAFSRAREILLARSALALRKAKVDGPTADFTEQEAGSFEAVIKIDGTRPALMLRGGAVPEKHPLIGIWADDVLSTTDVIRQAASAVGRIEPRDGSAARYWGTGFVIDDAGGLVLTNRHVMDDLLGDLHGFSEERAGTHRVRGGAFIDFAAEVGSTGRDRFKVVAARAVEGSACGGAKLDAAILRIEPLVANEADPERRPSTDFPGALKLTREVDGPLGQAASFAVMGFPGAMPPPDPSDLPDPSTGTVDWAWVTYELMGGRKGVKRIAPGVVHRPWRSLDDDPNQLSFGHDATTLGGNSGSPTLLWKDRGTPVFGLHFAGRTIDTNYAHAACRILSDIAATCAAV